MAIDDRGRSALDGYRIRLDRDLTCSKCGYDDADGEWQAATSGDRVQYRHVCPACGAIRMRELRLG